MYLIQLGTKLKQGSIKIMTYMYGFSMDYVKFEEN